MTWIWSDSFSSGDAQDEEREAPQRQQGTEDLH
jgi:hypothetical protein